MNANARPLIDIDWENFDPWRIQSVTHELSDHPLLQPDQLVALGKRFQGSTRLFTFNNGASAATNFDAVSRLYPNRKSVADTLQGIKDAKAWMLLRHVQADETYRSLIDLAFDPIQPYIERRDPGVYYRAGWIFVASPHTTTPFHIDRNHGILLQVRGHKKVYVWDAADTDVVSDRARDLPMRDGPSPRGPSRGALAAPAGTRPAGSETAPRWGVRCASPQWMKSPPGASGSRITTTSSTVAAGTPLARTGGE